MSRKFCNCFGCAIYCVCHCHHEQRESRLDGISLKNFDKFFDRVKLGSPLVHEKDIEPLCLDEKGIVRIGEFLLERGYKYDKRKQVYFKEEVLCAEEKR